MSFLDLGALLTLFAHVWLPFLGFLWGWGRACDVVCTVTWDWLDKCQCVSNVSTITQLAISFKAFFVFPKVSEPVICFKHWWRMRYRKRSKRKRRRKALWRRGKRKWRRRKKRWRRRTGVEDNPLSLTRNRRGLADLSYPSSPPPDTGHQEALRLQWAPGTHVGEGGLFWIGTHPPFVTKLTIFNSLHRLYARYLPIWFLIQRSSNLNESTERQFSASQPLHDFISIYKECSTDLTRCYNIRNGSTFEIRNSCFVCSGNYCPSTICVTSRYYLASFRLQGPLLSTHIAYSLNTQEGHNKHTERGHRHDSSTLSQLGAF